MTNMMSVAEAMAKAREYDKKHEDIPSVSRTLVEEIERLRAENQALRKEFQGKVWMPKEEYAALCRPAAEPDASHDRQFIEWLKRRIRDEADNGDPMPRYTLEEVLQKVSGAFRSTTFTSPNQQGNLPCDHCGWGVAQHAQRTLACPIRSYAVKSPVPHTTEDDFQHFLSYSGKRGQNEADLRLAYYAGADVQPPEKLAIEPDALRQNLRAALAAAEAEKYDELSWQKFCEIFDEKLLGPIEKSEEDLAPCSTCEAECAKLGIPEKCMHEPCPWRSSRTNLQQSGEL